MRNWAMAAVAALLFVSLASNAFADDYYSVSLGTVLKGEAQPQAGAPQDAEQNLRSQAWRLIPLRQPYAIGSNGEEIYISEGEQWNPPAITARTIAIRTAQGVKPAGTVFFFDTVTGVFSKQPFDLTGVEPGGEAARKSFNELKLAHYNNLIRANIPGGAWFRHEAMEAAAELGQKGQAAQAPRTVSVTGSEFERTYDLFSGGRALSENLQLDRNLLIRKEGEEKVPVDGITGITVKEFDWTPLIKDKNPAKDPLAKLIPFDQYALFFPSFQAMTDLIDKADAKGTPILDLLQPSSEDARVKERYQMQLGLRMDALSRILGPQVIKSVVWTSSDPSMRMGSDIALIFEAVDADALEKLIKTKTGVLTAASQLLPEQGEIGDISYSGVVTPGRAICSYIAKIGSAVVVTNSKAELQRIVQTSSGDVKNLSDLPEYTFFRDRYQLGDAKETALLVVPDAAIRRWCGPKWRIADSRRIRAAAAMMELEARNLPALAASKPITEIADAPEALGKVSLLPGGKLMSSTYNTVEFFTPVIEMDVTNVTQGEADAYVRFRDNYQRQWRDYFDPIAIRLTASADTIAADMTIWPLIMETEYKEVTEFAGKTHFAPTIARHPEAGLQFITALDRNSKPVKEAEQFGMDFAPGIGLGWLGDWGTLYFDKSPIWDELAKRAGEDHFGGQSGDWVMQNISRFPLGLEVATGNSLSLAAALTAIRVKIDQTAPNTVVWNNGTYNDVTYVKISPAQVQGRSHMFDNFAVYYVTLPDRLVITINEDLLKRAIDRSKQATAKPADAGEPTAPKPPEDPGWLGESVAGEASANAIAVIRALYRDPLAELIQEQSLRNIVILNEYRRRFGVQDPVAFHQNLWGVKLVCPAGGQYVWNEKDQTMESTAVGHIGALKDAGKAGAPLADVQNISAGLTFEQDGLRARMAIQTAK